MADEKLYDMRLEGNKIIIELAEEKIAKEFYNIVVKSLKPVLKVLAGAKK